LRYPEELAPNASKRFANPLPARSPLDATQFVRYATDARQFVRYATDCWFREGGTHPRVKKLLEIVLCFLHPIAVVLIWIDLVGRSEMDTVAKLTWGIAALVPIVPFVYVLTGHDII
jgi:hypothetical protein